MSDDDLIEQVARAICVAAGDDPDTLAMVGTPPIHHAGRYTVKVPDDWYRPLWLWKMREARAAFVCIRDLRGLKDVA